MLAIPPNRQSVCIDIQACGQTRLLRESMRIAVALAMLVGVSQRSWSESTPAIATSDASDADAKQCSANEPQLQQNAIRFVAANTPRVAPKAVAPKQPSPVATKPINTPPLTIADYKNYIEELWDAPRTEARPAPVPTPPQNTTPVAAPSIPKHVDPITVAEASGLDNRPPCEQLPRATSVDAKTEPAQGRLVKSVVPKPRQESIATVPDKSLAVNDSHPGSHSVIVATPVSVTNSNLVQTPAVEPHVAMREQALAMPSPAEPKVDSAPAHPESLPAAAADSPLMPLTNSSYLPANPENYCFRCGVKCPPCGCNPGGPGWAASRPIPWEVFAQGEYVGPARLAHVPVYRLRVDDQLAFVYRLSGQVSGQPYRLNVRDRIQVQSLSAPEVINREVIVEPDGTITLPLLGQVRASGATLDELRNLLDEQFKRQIKDPRITVTPLEMNSNLQELRSSVDRRYGAGGQVSDARISPDGTVQLPAIGSVPAQGLTLEELEREIKARYAQIVEGLEVTPILTARAPRFVYVVGEVRLPGRYSMEGPTTLMQAIALAGSWNVGAQLNQVVVFRRDENWQLMATTVNIRESLLFKKPCPSGEIWLRDSDIVLVPKSAILCTDDMINLIFTRGIYGVFPMSATLNFAKLTTL